MQERFIFSKPEKQISIGQNVLRPLEFNVFISEGYGDIDMANEAFNRVKGDEVILKTNSTSPVVLLCHIIFKNHIAHCNEHHELNN